jgi:hypothetical protein
VGTVWPDTNGGFYDSFNGGGPVDGTQPVSGGIHYTHTYDVPWDWAHRYPPAVTPSERPYVPSCPTEAVAVEGRDGQEQTISIMRCY